MKFPSRPSEFPISHHRALVSDIELHEAAVEDVLLVILKRQRLLHCLDCGRLCRYRVLPQALVRNLCIALYHIQDVGVNHRLPEGENCSSSSQISDEFNNTFRLPNLTCGVGMPFLCKKTHLSHKNSSQSNTWGLKHGKYR